jgi:DNA primase small subunit
MAMEGENTDVKSFFSTEYDQSQLPDMLKIYYTWIFPYKEYYQWLAYDKESFTHREFSFTLQDDIYVRYQSFDDQHELKECVKKSLPYKIDIGAMFNYKPKLNKSLNPGSFKAESKELVFDIDMTDYDDIRTCCSEANMCNKCWIYMKIAIKIIDRALEEDFGYSHRLWVYSGRRGVHCWVCDKEARQLSQSSRNSIAEYLTIIKGNEELTNKVNISSKQPLHPFVM